MKKYNYTVNWFEPDELLKSLSTKEEIEMLEVGCFEGKSTVWFLENLLAHPKSRITCIDPWANFNQDGGLDSYDSPDAQLKLRDDQVYERFLHNIRESGFEQKVNVRRGLSLHELSALVVGRMEFDIIFIDGNHTTPFVLTDAVLAWHILKPAGIIIFDDYLWGLDLPLTLRPAIAVDAFISCFADKLELVWADYRKAIVKLKK